MSDISQLEQEIMVATGPSYRLYDFQLDCGLFTTRHSEFDPSIPPVRCLAWYVSQWCRDNGIVGYEVLEDEYIDGLALDFANETDAFLFLLKWRKNR